MSIRYKIPLAMMAVFAANWLFIFLLFRFVLVNQVEQNIEMLRASVQDINAESLNLWGIATQLLLIECAILIIMFCITAFYLYRHYAKPITNLELKMEGYRVGEVLPEQQQRSDEIGKLENSFSKMTQSLHEEKQTQNRIIASISHDIKTPLTSVLGFSERLVKKDLDKEMQQQYLRIIHTHAKDIENIVHGFDEYLSVAVDSKNIIKQYSVEYICNMLGDEYADELEQEGIVFLVDNQCEPHTTVSVDLSDLRRVFANLIGNCITHAGTESLSIHINAYTTDGTDIVFRISDNGAGISPDDLPHIFEPFYTTDKSRSISGLGLAICKNIVQKAGGDITAQNNSDAGVSFLVRIPLILNSD